MTRKRLTLHRVLAILLPLALAIPGIGHGAPGTLADKPLFLSSTVKPNVLLLVDDSGSMDWEVVMSNRALDLFGEQGSNYLDPTPAGDEEQTKTEWREFCSAYNTLAYDPTVQYMPWAGVDDDGNPFGDVDSTSAPFHPYYADFSRRNLEDSDCEEGHASNPNSGESCSRSGTGYFYVPWTDANANNRYDVGECLPEDEGGVASKVFVRDMPAAGKQNYANWFSYYRKREYVAKRALTELTAGADLRMGLATLHDNNDVGTPVSDIGDTDPDGDKETLLANLARIDSNGGTPLRRTLEAAGQYFDREVTTGYGNRLGFYDPSPILDAAYGGACQQNFTVLMSDGYWNGSDPGVGNTDADGDGPFDGDSHADNASNTLADVAMKYYEEDLADAIVNRVPTQRGVDENEAQHLVTFGVAFGVNGTRSENPGNREDAFDWPTPVGDEPTTIDDLRHAAWNGRGEFLSAGNPQELITSLRGAFATIAERTGASSGVSFSSTSLQDDSAVYLATFDSSDWSGDLISVPLDDKTGVPQDKSDWSAADKLDGLEDWRTGRSIFTYNGNNGVAFAWDSLSNAQRNDLRTGPAGNLESEAVGRARLDYLRGDRTHEAEGTTFDFRARGSRLGDVVHSQPVQKNGVVFVGANDGMLHGFDATTGAEVMAYVPAALASTDARRGLHYLTNPTYSHRYYVDMTPTVTRSKVDDRDILVGALGAGGRGLFALDVTEPKSFSAGDVLWEFTAADDPDLGHTFSQPLIAKVPSASGPKWAAIVGNGYNDLGGGAATLFVLDLNNGTLIEKFSTASGTPEDRNGLATPAAIDQDGDGTVDRVYAGDLRGQMWAFDLSSAKSGNWTVAHGGDPLFRGNDDQPITAAPAVIRHPYIRDDVGNEPNVLVLFGTGRLLTEDDRYSTSQQSLYGVWDRGVGSRGRANLTAQPFERSDDKVRILGNNTVPYGDPEATGRDGWLVDLPQDKRERVLSSPVVRGDAAFFTTQIPSSAPCDAGGSGWLLAVRLDNGGQTATPVFDYDGDGVVGNEDDYVDDTPPAGLKFENQGLTSAPNFIGDRVLIACSDKSGFCDAEGGDDDTTGVGRKVAGITSAFSWEELLRD